MKHLASLNILARFFSEMMHAATRSKVVTLTRAAPLLELTMLVTRTTRLRKIS